MTQQDDDIVQKLHEAMQLRKSGLFQEALQVLHEVVLQVPACAPAYNNIGSIYFALQQYHLAIQAYQTALDIRPDYIDVYYNLGLAYSKMQQDDNALVAYRALLSLAPQHFGARFQLGCLLSRRQQFNEAAQAFKAALDKQSDHFESLANLAVCYLYLGLVDKAAEIYLRALEVKPDDKDVLFNLGVIHMQQGYAKDGVSYYLRAVKTCPDFFEAHQNLGAIYLMRRDNKNALLHFREALRIKPDAEALRHTIKIIMNDKNLTGSSSVYIQSLFDSYADYYDAHLSAHLHYQVPEKLYSALRDADVLNVNNLLIVDVGCGTGLCGELFKPHASYLVGIDLSEKMLEVAAAKKLYDELVLVEAVHYLANQTTYYDLILAGDVLVYFGQLEEWMAAVKHSLKPNGYFAFNVEITNEADYCLTQSGRFAHHQQYLERLASEYGFTITMMRSVVLREQQAEQVRGYLCLWQSHGSGVR